VPLKPLLSENPAWDVWRLGFWGATTWLLVLLLGNIICSFFFVEARTALWSSPCTNCDPLLQATHWFYLGSTSENGASNGLGMGPSSGYTLNSSSCINILIFILCTISVAFNMSWMYVFIPIYVMFMACALVHFIWHGYMFLIMLLVHTCFMILLVYTFCHSLMLIIMLIMLIHPVCLSYSAESATIQQCFSLTINQQTVLSATINQRNEQADSFRMNIYNVMMLLFIFSYDIIIIQLFFRIKLTLKLSKYLTDTRSA
jgi:hypothetical protein